MVVNEQIVVNALLVAFDLGGTFVFALSGAAAGVKNRLDLFGVLVLSFAAGNSGGITRDLMIGAAPPAASSSTIEDFVNRWTGRLPWRPRPFPDPARKWSDQPRKIWQWTASAN